VAFIQIIEYRTSKFDEMQAIGDEWDAASRAQGGTATRVVICRDRDDPGRYFNLAFFDSYESAMQNSEMPLTQEFAGRMMALADGPPTFHNLDVVDDRDER
jgi:hypothetical protein